jgi:hypothetical protein
MKLVLTYMKARLLCGRLLEVNLGRITETLFTHTVQEVKYVQLMTIVQVMN